MLHVSRRRHLIIANRRRQRYCCFNHKPANAGARKAGAPTGPPAAAHRALSRESAFELRSDQDGGGAKIHSSGTEAAE
jgi:hypothetical protein